MAIPPVRGPSAYLPRGESLRTNWVVILSPFWRRAGMVPSGLGALSLRLGLISIIIVISGVAGPPLSSPLSLSAFLVMSFVRFSP